MVQSIVTVREVLACVRLVTLAHCRQGRQNDVKSISAVGNGSTDTEGCDVHDLRTAKS
jgi:hypothetical protein